MLMKTQDIGFWLLAIGFLVKAKATAQPTKDTKQQGTRHSGPPAGDRKSWLLGMAKAKAKTTNRSGQLVIG